jgi:hypothetical protein
VCKIELVLEPQKSGIYLASYLTRLLARKPLMTKLRDAVRLARRRLETDRKGTAL